MAHCLKLAAATQLLRCCHRRRAGFSVTRSCAFLEKPEMEVWCTIWGFPDGSDSKESACSAGDLGSIPGFNPWVEKILWRRKWQPTPGFLPREFLFRKTAHHRGDLALFYSSRGSTYLLLTQTSAGEDQAHGQTGKHGASWGPCCAASK